MVEYLPVFPSQVLLPPKRDPSAPSAFGRTMPQPVAGEKRTPPFLLDQLQPQPAPPPIVHNQLQLFTAFSGPLNHQQCLLDAPFNDADIDLAFNILGSTKRAKKADDFVMAQRQPFTTIPVSGFLQNQRIGCISPSLPGGGVSTGLRLSFDDERSSPSSVSTIERDKTPPLASLLRECLITDMHQQSDEIDQLIKIQGEQLKQAVEERKRRQLRAFIPVIEDAVSKKLRDKDIELGNVARRNMELQDRVRQLSLEVHAWQAKAKYNETMVTALRSNLQHALTQIRGLGREGCGDSEVDDAASSHGGGDGNKYVRTFKENHELREQGMCRVCRNSGICMLLLPCRHLCLCKECEGRLDVCPLCRCMKSASVQVYMS